MFDDSYDDLNLELWSVEDGTATSLISESSSLYNQSEHFSFALPFTGDYALRVRWFREVFDLVGDAIKSCMAWHGRPWPAFQATSTTTALLMRPTMSLGKKGWGRFLRQTTTKYGVHISDKRSAAGRCFLSPNRCRAKFPNRLVHRSWLSRLRLQ